MVAKDEEDFESDGEGGEVPELDEEELDDEDLESLEQQKKKLSKPLGRPKNPSTSQNQTQRKIPQISQRQSPMPRPLQQPQQYSKRYGVFVQNARLGIMDMETKEVIAEGDMAVLEGIANLMERMERLETNIGSFTGE